MTFVWTQVCSVDDTFGPLRWLPTPANGNSKITKWETFSRDQCRIENIIFKLQLFAIIPRPANCFSRKSVETKKKMPFSILMLFPCHLPLFSSRQKRKQEHCVQIGFGSIFRCSRFCSAVSSQQGFLCRRSPSLDFWSWTDSVHRNQIKDDNSDNELVSIRNAQNRYRGDINAETRVM